MADGVKSSKGDQGRSRGGLMIFVWLDCGERLRSAGMRRSGPCERRGRGIEVNLQTEVCLRNDGADKKKSITSLKDESLNLEWGNSDDCILRRLAMEMKM